MTAISGNTDSTLLPEHGGDLATIRHLFPDAPDRLVDLSTGISPFPYPVAPGTPEELLHLPPPDAVRQLLRNAASAWGVPEGDFIAAVPGTQAAIGLLPLILRSKAVMIAGPTYSGHENSWQAAGRQVSFAPDYTTLRNAPEGTSCVVVSPNNPDGRVLSSDHLCDLAAERRRRGSFLIVDEAFADWDTESVIPALPMPGLIVLRSFGKTYGLPGVRLGFVVADPDIVRQVRAVFGSWPVSGQALACGLQALNDQKWHRKTGERLALATRRLRLLLQNTGWEIIGGTRLFTLVRLHNAHAVWATLCRAGIVTRAFTYDDSILRFGLPRNEDEWERLEAALRLFHRPEMLSPNSVAAATGHG